MSLNLTAHDFVDELSWVTIAHHDLLNADKLRISSCMATAYPKRTIRKACDDTRFHGYGMVRAKRNVTISVCRLLIHSFSELTVRLACDPTQITRTLRSTHDDDDRNLNISGRTGCTRSCKRGRFDTAVTLS